MLAYDYIVLRVLAIQCNVYLRLFSVRRSLPRTCRWCNLRTNTPEYAYVYTAALRAKSYREQTLLTNNLAVLNSFLNISNDR